MSYSQLAHPLRENKRGYCCCLNKACRLWPQQDVVGGRFDATQAFVGELSHFNIWDRVLRSTDIIAMSNCSSYISGNVVAWTDSNIEVFGGASMLPLELCEDRLFDN